MLLHISCLYLICNYFLVLDLNSNLCKNVSIQRGNFKVGFFLLLSFNQNYLYSGNQNTTEYIWSWSFPLWTLQKRRSYHWYDILQMFSFCHLNLFWRICWWKDISSNRNVTKVSHMISWIQVCQNILLSALQQHTEVANTYLGLTHAYL